MSHTKQVVNVDIDSVRAALKEWGKLKPQTNLLESLHQFRYIQRRLSNGSSNHYQNIPGMSSSMPNQRRVLNTLLYEAIIALEPINPTGVKLLTDRFLDDNSIRELAHQRNVAESNIFKQINQALDDLTIIIQTHEENLLSSKRERWLQRIDTAPYLKLIGVEESQESLHNLLVSEEPPWIISIEGIGGIGKTSLAHSVVSRVFEECPFDEIVWVSAKTSRLLPAGLISDIPTSTTQAQSILYELLLQIAPQTPAASAFPVEQLASILRSEIKGARYLVVIDNLETITDIQELLPHVESLTNPSCVLLTSRQHRATQQETYQFVVPELGEADTIQLIRQEAQWRNVSQIAELDDAQLKPLYECAGGNPLALRLIVGLARTQSICEIIADLRDMQGTSVTTLYNFIYQAAWDNLDDLSRQVLLYTPMIQQGGDTGRYFAESTGLAESDVRQSLNNLASVNLVTAHPSSVETRYSVHSLTRSFVSKQLLQFQPEHAATAELDR